MTESGIIDLGALYGMPGHLVRRLHQVSTALFMEECGGLDMTSVQFAALIAIRANPDVDATRLSALIAFDRSTLGNVLERLEAKQWVIRSGHPGDRRIKRLHLSAAGAAILDQVMPGVRRVQHRLLAPLAEADRAVLVQLLAQLAGLHGEPAAPPTDIAD